MTTNFKYSEKYTEPDSDIANVFEICYAPRSTRRTNGPIYAMDFYTNKVVVFDGSSETQTAETSSKTKNRRPKKRKKSSGNVKSSKTATHAKMEESDEGIDVKMEEEFEEVQINFNESKATMMEMFMKNVVSARPDIYKKMLKDAKKDKNFHNDQYMPALENLSRFVEDPEGSGIEDLSKGQYEDHQQEDGTIVSIPLDPHPVIFPIHIQNRERERLLNQQLDAEKRELDERIASQRARQERVNAYVAARHQEALEIQRQTAEILERLKQRNAQAYNSRR